jgi:adenosylmethionine-8-amino-7-oxononanoate aminotransferase
MGGIAIVNIGYSRPDMTEAIACSGSEANDTPAKLVHWYRNTLGKPSKKHIISRELAYHGSIGSINHSFLPSRFGFIR